MYITSNHIIAMDFRVRVQLNLSSKQLNLTMGLNCPTKPSNIRQTSSLSPS